jgi:hypothetical protein
MTAVAQLSLRCCAQCLSVSSSEHLPVSFLTVLGVVFLLLHLLLDVLATASLLLFDTLKLLSVDACCVSPVTLPALFQAKPVARAAVRLERFGCTARSGSDTALRLHAVFMLTPCQLTAVL